MAPIEHLSENLSVAEFLRTQHVDLVPDQVELWQSCPELRANAVRLAEEVFEPCRAVLRVPLRVTSGLRCPELNHRVGGKPTSRHLFGLAIDVVPGGALDPMPALYCLMHALRRGELPHLDQAIIEGSPATGKWLHLQAAQDGRPSRQLVLQSEDGREFARVA
jgi:hypothetical protein